MDNIRNYGDSSVSAAPQQQSAMAISAGWVWPVAAAAAATNAATAWHTGSTYDLRKAIFRQ